MPRKVAGEETGETDSVASLPQTGADSRFARPVSAFLRRSARSHLVGPDGDRVSDHHVDFFLSSLVEAYHCETVPALYPLHPAINDLTSAPVAARTVPYGYPFGVAGIMSFFDQHLRD